MSWQKIIANDQPRQRRRGRYPKEFRKDAVALVIDQKRTIADVAKQLGVVEQTLGNWVRQERIDRGEREGLSSEERAHITELERQVKHLTMERDGQRPAGIPRRRTAVLLAHGQRNSLWADSCSPVVLRRTASPPFLRALR